MNEIFNSSHKMFIQIYSQKLLGCSVKILGFDLMSDPVAARGAGRGTRWVGTGVERGQNLGCFYDHWVCDHFQVQ